MAFRFSLGINIVTASASGSGAGKESYSLQRLRHTSTQEQAFSSWEFHQTTAVCRILDEKVRPWPFGHEARFTSPSARAPSTPSATPHPEYNQGGSWWVRPLMLLGLAAHALF